MLALLEIKNYAIIQHVRIEFDKGLNIITGETGAGKSILLGALGLSLGDRADTKILYHQEEKCIIEASFNIANYKLQYLFEELDLDYQDKTIIRREINPNGKSRAFVNDTPVTLETLKLLAEHLVNLTSQHETQQLNKESYQINVLDASAENYKTRTAYLEVYKQHDSLKQELTQLVNELAQIEKDLDFLSFQLQEIQEAKLDDENLENLEEELNSLNNAETIKSKLFTLANSIENNDVSILGLLNEAYHNLHEISKYKKEYDTLAERINSSIIELEDIKNEAENIADLTSFDEDRIQVLSLKVNEGNRLLRKHHLNDLKELTALKEHLIAKTSSVQTNALNVDQLKMQLSVLEQERNSLAETLSKSRIAAAKLVKLEIEATMKQVGMPNAIFEIDIQEKSNYAENGKDKISFLFNANKGFAPQAMSKIASGGELSRVMLSIQALLAKKTALPTLIFDEIDTGISGETAAKVAEVFRTISKEHQLIAVTHLPQIAARAEKHLFIYKNDTDEKTETKIASLKEDQHVKAIARMLSGENISEESLNNARSLIKIQ
jgi:DNA repair protein RecN (Recombination protein N)